VINQILQLNTNGEGFFMPKNLFRTVLILNLKKTEIMALIILPHPQHLLTLLQTE